MGNRDQEGVDGACPATNYTYNEANQLNEVSIATCTERPMCADRRDIIAPPHCTDGSDDSFYEYNGDGLLTNESQSDGEVDGASATYAWDYSSGVPTIAQKTVTGDSPDTTEYIAGPAGLPLEQWDSNTGVSYYYQDRLGSTIALLNQSADVQATYSYSPFGMATEEGGDDSASTPLLYGGQLSDTASLSGLIYMRARWYDPATDQFMSRDPDVAQTMAPYAYAADDPTDVTDPTGLHGTQQQLTNLLKHHQCNAKGPLSVYQKCVSAREDAFSQWESELSGVASNLEGQAEQQLELAGTAFGEELQYLAAHPQETENAALLAITLIDPEEGISVDVGEAIGARVGADLGEAIAEDVGADAAAAAGDEAAAATGDEAAGAEGDAATSCLNSFTAATPVVMAGGAEEPISKVKVGDKVLATDPQSGVTEARPVEALIRHSGVHKMVELTLADGSTIDSTDRHPIWDATTGRFTDAIDLRVGDRLLTDAGPTVTIASERVYHEKLTAYNLEIGGIHTYYAGSTPVLVHNSCPISMDEAVERGAAHVGGDGEIVTTSRGNFQFIGREFENPSGGLQRNIARFDIQNLRAGEVPHLNLEVQLDGVPQPWLDPHTPIEPFTVLPGDVP